MYSAQGPRVEFKQAAAFLKENDEILKDIIDRVGECTIALEEDPFTSLAQSIIHQQLSMKAAGTIYRRFASSCPGQKFPAPTDVLAMSDDTLRAIGLSQQKTCYLKDLAEKFLDGTLTPSQFQAMSDEEIIHQLTQVKGVGRWTAEMFLIFSQGRPDVLPVDDLGLRKAAQRLYADEASSPAKLRILGEKWRPYCTVATWYLWRSLDSLPFEQST